MPSESKGFMGNIIKSVINTLQMPVCWVLLSVFCGLLYWPGLYGPLLLDDEATFGAMLGEGFAKNHDLYFITEAASPMGPHGRLLSIVSFYFNAIFSQDIFYWKLTNLIIHLLCAYVIFVLVNEIHQFIYPSETTKHPVTSIAFVVSAVWLLHPLHISTVLYTVQRMTQLSTLFVLLGVVAYLKARISYKKTSQSSWWLYFFAWAVCFPLGVFSKESALLFPVYIVLLEVFILSGKRVSTAMLVKLFGVLFVLGLGLLWVIWDWLQSGYAAREFTLSQRLLTEARIVCDYIGMILIPAQKNMSFMHDDYILSTGFFSPISTFVAIVFLASLFVFSLFIRKREPIIAFGVGLFFVGHLMESTVIHLELMFEHRNYLPSLGLILATTYAVRALMKEAGIKKLLTVAVISLLSFSTWLRADTWSSNITLFYYIETHHPKSERIVSIKADEAAYAGSFDLARQKLDRIDSLGSKLQRLKVECLESGQLGPNDLDINIPNEGVATTYVVMGLVNLANLGLDKKCIFPDDKYIALSNRMLERFTATGSNRQMIMMYKAHFLAKIGHQSEAIDTLSETFELDQGNPVPLFLACEWLLDWDVEKSNAVQPEQCTKALKIAELKAPRYSEYEAKVRARLDNN